MAGQDLNGYLPGRGHIDIVVFCPGCERAWWERAWYPEHVTGSQRECPYSNCRKRGLEVELTMDDGA